MDNNSKLDKIQEDVGEIKIHLAVYNALLDTHIKRTELLEQQMEPVKRHVAMVNGALKLLAGVGLVVGIIEGLIRVIK